MRRNRSNRSKESDDSDLSREEVTNFYTVHLPLSPENAPVQGPLEEVETQNTLKQSELEAAAAGGGANKGSSSSCAMLGCDGKTMTDEQGQDVYPCVCQFKICGDCYRDAKEVVDSAAASCPGCKEPYNTSEFDDMSQLDQRQLSLAPSVKMDKSLSLSVRNQNQIGDFDQENSLYGSHGTFGFGSALWPKNDDEDIEGIHESEPWRPLTRKIKISAAVISPYRLLIFVRVVVLVLFLMWRVKHKNDDAMWLWGMSVVCEIWFAFSWLLDQMPKFNPVRRATDLDVLKQKFETRSPFNPTGKSDLPGIDVFVSTADPDKEPPLVTANTILSILAADYPVDKLACYVSDDGGALLTFEAMAEAASFANLWVPFCRKHDIEPRNPESYFNQKRDPYMQKVRQDFVRDYRRVRREYNEFKVRINGLPDSIRRRSDAYHAREEIKAIKIQRQAPRDDEPIQPIKIRKATWTADGTHWPGTWLHPAPEHSKGDHTSIIQVILNPPSDEPLHTTADGTMLENLTGVDIRLPMLVYVSREKRPGYDHNKKAGAMNALVRASAIMSNGAFILNLDCDHYIYNSQAMREGMCFMMDRAGDRLCYVQFPQRFEGIDPSDRYANHNTVFFDVNMLALDGLQGPVYVGTGCLFRRVALYGFDPPRSKDYKIGWFNHKRKASVANSLEEKQPLQMRDEEDDEMNPALFPKKFGNSSSLVDSIPVAEFQGRPLADHQTVKNGRPPAALTVPRDDLDASTVMEVIAVVSCWYEDKTEWGHRVGWIYGSVTEDVVTGYRMHNRGWKSVYCVTKRDAFHGTAPINLTDRLHQVLRWATGSVEIFFSRNNALLASSKMKILQRIAYLNVGIYPFTSIFLIVYCFLPALSLYSGQFIVKSLEIPFLCYLLTITFSLCILALLEIKWSGIVLEEWWRNEQFWLIGGTSAHLVAVVQGLLKVIAGIEISFTLTSKSTSDDEDDEFADLYIFKWTSLMIPPLTIIMVNLIAIVVGINRTIYSSIPQWSKLLGGVFFSFWVLAHLYPFAKGLMGRRGRTPTVVYVWAGLTSIIISLLWVTLCAPSDENTSGVSFHFP